MVRFKHCCTYPCTLDQSYGFLLLLCTQMAVSLYCSHVMSNVSHSGISLYLLDTHCSSLNNVYPINSQCNTLKSLLVKSIYYTVTEVKGFIIL
jgi:hypothetical protein